MSRRSISLLSSLLFVLLLFTPTILADSDSEHEFQEFARDVPADRLHAALHDYSGSKFKHGVFPGDRPALDVIHRERAADATRLVKLAKRQSNTTTTSRNTATTATTARPTSNTPTTIVSTSPSSTGQSTQSTQSTRQTTSESGSTTAAPSVTAKRGTTSSTSKITRTVTGPDGSLSTETSVTIVVATPTDESTPSSPGETASSTDKSTPGLQQNAGLRVSGGDSVIVAVIAALGFFML